MSYLTSFQSFSQVVCHYVVRCRQNMYYDKDSHCRQIKIVCQHAFGMMSTDMCLILRLTFKCYFLWKAHSTEQTQFRREHIGHVARMSVFGYRGRRFEPRQHQYVVFLSKTLYPHCDSRFSCEMSTR